MSFYMMSRVVITEVRPWTFQGQVDPNKPQWKGWQGVLVDMIDDMASPQKANLNINLIDGWATENSRKIIPNSSYTACAFDIGVGNFDLCLADFWVTPERLTYTKFVTAFSQDLFYLWVPKERVEDTYTKNKNRIFSMSESAADMFSKPFMPFSSEVCMYL